MADPERISDHDMTKLNFTLSLDGKSLDFQAVFSAFENQINNGKPLAAPSPDYSLGDIISTLEQARDEARRVDSMVESSVGDVISAASSVAADCASDYASERVSEDAWEHSPGDNVNYEVSNNLESALDMLNTLNGRG